MNWLTIAMKYRKQIASVLVVLALLAGTYTAGFRHSSAHCKTEKLQADAMKMQYDNEQLQIENASLRAASARTERVRKEVRNATKGIVPGDLPAYTSAALDCMRGGDCVSVQPAAVSGRQ
jgi:hypothetical protein